MAGNRMLDRPAGGNGTGRTTLLIVEDEALMRRTLRSFLERALPRWTILEADGGERALEMCAAHRPGVVLMDQRLPDTDGISLTPKVKDLLPEARVLFVSYYTGDTYIERAFAAGASAYIPKDRLFSDLLPAIEAVSR